jgi:hypothetical protein
VSYQDALARSCAAAATSRGRAFGDTTTLADPSVVEIVAVPAAAADEDQ